MGEEVKDRREMVHNIPKRKVQLTYVSGPFSLQNTVSSNEGPPKAKAGLKLKKGSV